jgi:hypothetical protein
MMITKINQIASIEIGYSYENGDKFYLRREGADRWKEAQYAKEIKSAMGEGRKQLKALFDTYRIEFRALVAAQIAKMNLPGDALANKYKAAAAMHALGLCSEKYFTRERNLYLAHAAQAEINEEKARFDNQ